jgi:hypothetical protein
LGLNDSISQPERAGDVFGGYLFRYANDLSNSYGREFARLPISRCAYRSTLSFLINYRQPSTTLEKHVSMIESDAKIDAEKEKPRQVGAFLFNFWRREPESNRPKRLCRPLHNRFAIAP